MMRFSRLLCLVGLLSALALATRPWTAAPAAPTESKPTPTFKEVAPLIQKYCVGCHGGAKPKAGLALDVFKTAEDVTKGQKIWEKVADNLRSGDMPPPGRRQPTADEMDRLNAWLDLEVFKVDCSKKDPGRVTIRRLNRAEYNNTIRDLVGVNFQPADDFPSDDVGYGFDNIGDVLSMPPILMEKYLAAAEKILDSAIVHEKVIKSSRQVFRPQNLIVTPRGAKEKTDRRITFTTVGQTFLNRFHFSHEGEFVVRVRAQGEGAGKELPHLVIRIDDKDIKAFDVTVGGGARVYEARTHVKEGDRKVAAAFTNPFKDTTDKDPKKHHDRKLIVETLEIEGPFNVASKPLPETHRRIMIAKPTGPGDKEAAAAKIIENFARRAYRRPVTRDEVARLVRLFKVADSNGEPFENGIKLALQGVLVSPHFLFRIEQDREPNNPDAVTTISEFELATRLSYFLWSSMPDDELFKLAEQGQLRKPGVLDAQVKRMLKDPRSRSLFDNFASQWLTLRNLKEIKPDPRRFPTFNDRLRDSMIEETRQFFNYVVREDRKVVEFLDADYAFLNERLAKHYGIPNVRGDEFRKVLLTEEQHRQRGGLLMQGSVLTVTSNPTRTSPVKRGKFILDNILGTPPQPPPPDVPELKEGGELKGTLRQRMEQHRANAACASCHQRMDPLGFGFENFDAVGAWRLKDGKEVVDSTGTLPGEKSFDGPAELRSLLLDRKETFVRCLADKLLTFALGRGTKRSDQCFTDEIAKNVAKQDYKFSALVIEIVKSDPFQKRKGKRDKP